MGGNIGNLLGHVLSILPMFLVYATGIGIAAVRWQRHPRVSRLCLAGFGCMLLGLLINTGINLWLIDTLDGQNIAGNPMLLLGISTLIHLCCDVVGWGFLMFALFGGRKEA